MKKDECIGGGGRGGGAARGGGESFKVCLGIGIYFFTVNIFAYGIGAPTVGKLNDWLGVSTNPSAMRYSLLLSPLACALSAVFLFLGARSLERSSEGAGEV